MKKISEIEHKLKGIPNNELPLHSKKYYLNLNSEIQNLYKSIIKEQNFNKQTLQSEGSYEKNRLSWLLIPISLPFIAPACNNHSLSLDTDNNQTVLQKQAQINILINKLNKITFNNLNNISQDLKSKINLAIDKNGISKSSSYDYQLFKVVYQHAKKRRRY
ncbi:hypothetical protein MCFN_00580 [Mycoplasmopsis californica]|uniref:Uncharacterized protein n=1 Tax=Mycoplasmopsis californica TaxID=2113 RepID=A0A059XLB5_9BACT|nr:hypothetical protein [Mycoplasmopsis californica]AIA29284.1 hypothetical protein MCFN_00580 [Mycoplasmopsis californica]